jgi:hypothetical protein
VAFLFFLHLLLVTLHLLFFLVARHLRLFHPMVLQELTYPKCRGGAVGRRVGRRRL